MDIQRIVRSVGGAIFYFAVYIMCQLFVGSVVSYMVTFSYAFIYTYSSVEPTDNADALSQINLEEIMKATSDSALQFITDNLFLISIITAVFSIFVYFLIFKLRKKKFTAEVGIFKMSGLSYPISLVLGITLNFLIVGIISIMPIPEHLMEEYANAAAPITESAMTPTAIIMTVLITPIIEEVVFRGLIYTRIKRCMPMLGAMILSSFIFGVMHGTSVVWVAYASVLGFFMAWIFEKCGSLWASILLHMGFNSVGMLTVLLPENISPLMLLHVFAASGIISVLLIAMVNKRSNNKIEIGMPSWETNDSENGRSER